MSIIIKDLSYTYDLKTTFASSALKHITLDINEGDFLGIIGHTGSGKSTLVSHLNALIRVQSGTVVVNGMDITPKRIDFKKLRSMVGMVFQYPEYQLFAETVEKDVAFGPKNLGLAEGEISQRVKEAITLVGLDYNAIKERSPFELSGGQMRRVALAGVIAMRPDILILDEPTAGLDPRGKREIMELINQIRKTCSAVIMISHNMDEVASYCNRIAVLANGELALLTTPEQLYAHKELLLSIGVEMPSVQALVLSLNERGFNLDGRITNENELITALTNECRRMGLCEK